MNEMVVIAAVIVDREIADKYLQTLPTDCFYGKGHATIWATLQELQRRQLSYDPATALQLSGGEIDVQLVAEYVEQRPAAPPNIRHHIACVLWDRARVEAVKGPVQLLLDGLRDPRVPPEKVRALAQQVGKAFEGHGTGSYLRTQGDVVREARTEMKARRLGRACYPYGIPALDNYCEGDVDKDGNSLEGAPRLIPGAAPGTITLVTGVTGSGKSTTTKIKVVNLAMQGRKVCCGAWEEGEAQTLQSFAAVHLGWDRSKMMTGGYTEAEEAEHARVMEVLSENIRFLKLPRGKKGMEQLEVIQSAVADSGADVFMADLMQRSVGDVDLGEETQFLYEMQDWGLRQKVHQIWLHQQRFKDIEQRKDKRPTREGIKGSGVWVEVPDLVIGWHREALWKNVPDNRIEAIILKQRFAPWPQAVEFEYDPALGTIGDGWTIQYDRPGAESSMDDELFGPSPSSKGGGKKKWNA